MRNSSHRPRLTLLAALYAGLALVAHATGKPDASGPELSEADDARIRTAIIIATFDELHGRCTRAGGFDAAQREEADRWLSNQRIDELRAHLDGTGLSAPLREQVRAASAPIIKQLVEQLAAGANPCAAAVKLTRTADAGASPVVTVTPVPAA